MAKVVKKSRTESFSFGNKPSVKLPSPEEVNNTLAKVTGQESVASEPIVVVAKQETVAVVAATKPSAATPVVKTPKAAATQHIYQQVTMYTPPVAPEPVYTPPPVKTPSRVPLTTAITPELRAKLEVAAVQYNMNVSDLIHEALDLYFEKVRPVTDLGMLDTFTSVYSRKAK